MSHRKDTATSTLAVHSIAAQVADGAPVTGASVDCLGFRSVIAVVTIGTVTPDGTGDAAITPVIEDSDNGSTGWNAVAGALLVGALEPVDNDATGSTQRVGYLGGKRHVRVTTSFDEAAEAPVAAVILLGAPAVHPAQQWEAPE